MSCDALTPCIVEIADADLDDLRSRLAGFAGPTSSQARVGTTVSRARSLDEHPRFLTEIDAQRVHFLHVRSPEPDALPLICTHGRPMSAFEYLELIGPLADPRNHGGDAGDAFHLVIPSLPGVAFSGPTSEPGWDTGRIARAWVTLMERLGYDRHGAHGNDVGSMVSPEVGRLAADRVVGVHVTQLFSFPSGDPSEFADLSDEDQAALAFLQEFTSGGGLAYNAYQSAQPQTLAYALQDSPAGWAAWVSQLLRDAVDKETLLTHATTYWVTDTVGSSIRRYHADARAGNGAGDPTTVPTGGCDLRAGLPVGSQVRRPRPLEHRQLEPLSAGQPLLPARCARPARRRHPRLLQEPALACEVSALRSRSAAGRGCRGGRGTGRGCSRRARAG